MKREIKFRGKRTLNKESVMGNLMIRREDSPVPETSETYTSYYIVPIDGLDYYEHEVDPSTIGQYTGLKDKHGKEIYEGDVVRFCDSHYNAYPAQYTGEVSMHNGIWCVEYDGECGTERRRLFADDFASRKTEVLGNVCDNPELTE